MSDDDSVTIQPETTCVYTLVASNASSHTVAQVTVAITDQTVTNQMTAGSRTVTDQTVTDQMTASSLTVDRHAQFGNKRVVDPRIWPPVDPEPGSVSAQSIITKDLEVFKRSMGHNLGEIRAARVKLESYLDADTVSARRLLTVGGNDGPDLENRVQIAMWPNLNGGPPELAIRYADNFKSGALLGRDGEWKGRRTPR